MSESSVGGGWVRPVTSVSLPQQPVLMINGAVGPPESLLPLTNHHHMFTIFGFGTSAPLRPETRRVGEGWREG